MVTSATSGVAQPAPTGTSGPSGVAQPAALQFAELNQRSASLSEWDVGIFHAGIEEWTYKDKTTMLEKKGAAFRCLLVSLSHPNQYARGEVTMGKDDRTPLNQADAALKDNKAFRISQVRFQTATAQEYVHTPQKFVVNLKQTKRNPLMSHKEGEIVQAQPSMTLAEINDLKQAQRFDVTALVEQVGEPRDAGKTGRVYRRVTLIDQSGKDSKVQQTVWSFLSDSTPNAKDRAVIDILREAEGKDRAHIVRFVWQEN